jgi:hypothetical protein
MVLYLNKMLNKIIFQIGIVVVSALTSIIPLNTFAFNNENLEYQGEIAGKLKQFQDDSNDSSKDYQLNLETKLQTKYTDNNNYYQFGFFSRIDSNDSSRNIINFDEVYYTRSGMGTSEQTSISIGNRVFNWSMMEVFHPVDNINARNFDSNGDLTERLGQPSLVLKREYDSLYIELILLLDTVDSLMPSSSNRNGAQLSFNKPRYATADLEDTSNPNSLGSIVHLVKNFDNFDLDLSISKKYDTNYPVISIEVDKNTSPTADEHLNYIYPFYVPVRQYTAAASGNAGEYILKFEHAYFDFEDFKVPFLTAQKNTVLTKQDFSLTAFGIEKTTTYSNDQEGTFILEYQTVLGTTIEEARSLVPFQRDIAFAYRHNFNDFKGHEIIFILITDLDTADEHIVDLAHSFRLNTEWKFNTTLRTIEAKETNSGLDINNFTGLRPIAESDQINIKLTRFF